MKSCGSPIRTPSRSASWYGSHRPVRLTSSMKNVLMDSWVPV
jgi:hypothetical protein